MTPDPRKMQQDKSGRRDGRGRGEGLDVEQMPVAMLLDLLVDGELPEDMRAAVLGRLDAEPNDQGWRELAIRFLQSQVERRSMRELMAGGRVVPVDFAELSASPMLKESRWRITRWLTPGRCVGVAAGLLLAVMSAVITVHVMDGRGVLVVPNGSAAGALNTFRASLPESSIGASNSLAVDVPVVDRGESGRPWTFMESANRPSPRRSVVIQPDGQGNAVVFPVNTYPVSVY